MLSEGRYLGGIGNYRLLACGTCGNTWQALKGRYCPECLKKPEKEVKKNE